MPRVPNVSSNTAARWLAAVLPFLLAACESPPAEAPTVPPAMVIRAQPGATSHVSLWSGEVRARHEADLAFRIPGKLVERSVDVGATVKAGEVLARIDSADVSLNADTAQAQMLAAETDYRYSKAEMSRYEALLAQKFISPAIYDGKRAQYVGAKARFEQARLQASLAGNQSGYAALRADRAGVVTLVMAEAGQVVGAGQPVLRLAQLDRKEVLVAVAENRLAGLREGALATVRLWAVPDRHYRARVREIAPMADPMTRTFATRFEILDAGPEVRLGMTANVALADDDAAAISLPLTALTRGDGQDRVWVVVDAGNGEPATVQPRAVRVGRYTNDAVTVLEGLRAGERVVALGVHKLLPGMRIRPVEQASAAAEVGAPAAGAAQP